MSDPVDERLRSYYRSIGGDPPAGLETRVARALDSAAAKPFASQVRAPWRPAFGLVAAGVAVIVVALVVRSLAPVAIPSASASPMAGQSAWPTPTPVPTPPPTPTPGVTMPTSQPESPSPGLSPTARPAGTLEATGAMNPALSQTVAVRLADGRVLITGGREGRSNGVTLLRSQAAEIYDPNGGVFTPTGSMADPRAGHTATLLNDGRVLVVGGIDAGDGFDNLATAELYDPATGQFTPTGSLAQGRAHQTATLLDDGRVLIAGGYGGGTLSLKSAEIYDPATGKFTATGSMTVARRDATATLLVDGRVLIAGGLDQYATSALASAEVYDPATGKFTATGSMAAARSGFGAMGLEDGRVLVVGGRDATGAILESAEIYDPGTAKFSPAGSMTAAGASTAVWLKDARVLFVSSGGMSVYDPASETFSPVGNPTASIDTATFAVGDVLLTEGGPAQVYLP
jgi:hypothetical protein